jgi:hypothetical protein
MIDFFTSGGQSEFFTDWDSAREFVQVTVIGQNPRLTTEDKNDLLVFEEEAYRATNGQFFASESREIADYYSYLSNNVSAFTDDADVIAILASASGASVDVADSKDVDPIDIIEGAEELFTPSEEQKKIGRRAGAGALLYIGALGVLYVVLAQK